MLAPHSRRGEARQREHESVVGSLVSFRLVSSRLASPRARSTPSRYFGRESKDHETRGEAYLLHSRVSSVKKQK